MENDKQLDILIDRVSKLENKKNKKDIWDIFSTISSFLIPLSIFFAGFFLSEADRKAQLQNKEKEIQIAEIQSKVDQAELVSVFLEALVDTNPYRRQLAIKSILLALPEKGLEIVEEISVNDPNEDVKEFAQKSLTDSKSKIRTDLIQNIFSPVKTNRIESTNKLINDWGNDDVLVPEMIDYANQRLDDVPEHVMGLVNTIVVLNNVNVTQLRGNWDKVNDFINNVESIKGRPQTKDYLNILKDRLNPRTED